MTTTTWGTVVEVTDSILVRGEQGGTIVLLKEDFYHETPREGDLVAITEENGRISACVSCGFARGMSEEWNTLFEK